MKIFFCLPAANVSLICTWMSSAVCWANGSYKSAVLNLAKFHCFMLHHLNADCHSHYQYCVM